MVPKTPAVGAREVEWLIAEKYPGLFRAGKWQPFFRALFSDIARLEKGEPLAYVIGNVSFLGLRILTDKRALIPRVETEWWVERALHELRRRRGPRVLDLCSGSGAIGLAVLKKIPKSHVTFGELDPKAIGLIKANLAFHRLPGTRYRIVRSDLFSKIKGRFDAILANPPYIPAAREKKLPVSVTRYEPRAALYGGGDGLIFSKRILKEAPQYLAPGGVLYMEFDAPQAKKIKAMIGKRGKIYKDQYGRFRYLKSAPVE